MSSPFPRAATVVAAAVAVLLVLAPAAAAHVTVSSQDAEPGSYGKLTFRVPNESDTASTVSVRIQIPEQAAMGSVQAQPVPGWRMTTSRTELPEPLDVHGQQLTEYVSLVEFRAEEGGIAPGQFQEFALSGGPFPDVESVSYPTVQVYSDGSEAAWIEPTVGGEEPESPAPTLQLAAAQEVPAADAGGAVAEVSGTDGRATTALVLSVLGLLAGLAGLAFGWSARRRTVSA